MADLRYSRLVQATQSQIAEIEALLATTFHTVYQTPRWAALLTKHFGLRVDWHLLHKGGALVGACPTIEVKTGFLKDHRSWPVGTQSVYGGWVLSPEVRLSEALSATRSGLGPAATFTATVLTPPNAEGPAEAYIPKAGRKKTLLVDLAPSEDDIFAQSVDSDHRNKIRKAAKGGVVIEDRGPEEGLRHWEPWLRETHERGGMKVLPKAYLEDALREFAAGTHAKPQPNGEAAFIVLAHDPGADKPLSGLFAIGNKHMIHYWLGGSAEELPINAHNNKLLHWEAIRKSKALGSAYYDLCMYEPDRLPGIARFKSGFSKLEVPVQHVHVVPATARAIRKLSKIVKR